MDIFSRLQEICKSNGTTPTALCKRITGSSGNLSTWKKGNIRADYLQEIADYFDVSVDYLLTGAKKEAALSEESNATFLSTKKIHLIPLFGDASAGFGAYADSTILEYIPVYIESPAEAAETICIKVKGNSMAPRIEDGDVVQVRKQTSVDSGSLAVVLVGEDEGFVKKVNYGDDWIELISLNEKYPPMRFEGEHVQKIQVVGLVKKIIKEV